MLLTTLIIIPMVGIFSILLLNSYHKSDNKRVLKFVALVTSLLNLIVSLIVWILYNSSSKYFQFVQDHYQIGYYDFYLGIDGLSIYFVLLTTIIMPISIISNWKSIKEKVIYFLCIMLLLEALLLLIYMVLDLLMFYIFFESILAPLFILIGIFGSVERQRASFYFFLYTFLGSLFMLLSIITVSYLSGCTDITAISKNGFTYMTQLLVFMGIFIAFAVKTPVIYLNGWLLKAHVESPLSGSIILAAIVLKLSLYGIFRLILILSPKAYIVLTYIIFMIGVITIIYASLSTLRTIDIKELIAYSSVSHAAVYFIAVFSNVIQGIIGAICLGLAHGFVSSGLFAIVGGVLYDRSGTRVITYYRGLVQAMPILSILFFILCLGNCGAPLTLNFIGEFMSLYGVFERLPLAGIFASSSIIFSAAFTIFMFNRIMFGGSLYVRNWIEYIVDVNLREYSMLLVLVMFTVSLGIYPSIITDGLNYIAQGLLFTFDNVLHNSSVVHNDSTFFSPIYDINPDIFTDKHTLYSFMLYISLIVYIFSPLNTSTNKASVTELSVDATNVPSPAEPSTEVFTTEKLSLDIPNNNSRQAKIIKTIVKRWTNLKKFNIDLLINLIYIVAIPMTISLILVNRHGRDTMQDPLLFVKYFISMCITVLLIMFLIHKLKNKSEILKLKSTGYIQTIYYKLLDFCLLQLSIIGLTSFFLCYNKNSDAQTCLISIWAIISISLLVYNYFFNEKKKNFLEYFKVFEIKQIWKKIVNYIKENWLKFLCFATCIFVIRILMFNRTNNIILEYLTIVFLVKIIQFAYIFVIYKIKGETFKNAFVKSLTLTIETYTCKNLITGLIIFIFIFNIKLYIVSGILYLYAKGLYLSISIFKLNLDITFLQKFYLENKQNILRFNITKIKLASLFKCFIGISKASLNLHLQFNNGIKNSILFNVTPPGESINVDNNITEDIESSSDKVQGCPGGFWHDYTWLLDKFGRDHSEMYSIYEAYGFDKQGRDYINHQRIQLARHIVRHHQFRDTPLGLNAYSVLFFWASQTSPVWNGLGGAAQMVLAQDPNMAVNIERLKDPDSGAGAQINECASKHSARVITHLREIRRANANYMFENWTYKNSLNFNDQLPDNYDGWSVGTIGLNNKNKMIESIRENGPITFSIESKKIEFPRHCPDTLGALIKEGPGYQKFEYNGRWHSNCFYVIADPYNVATNKFDPQGTHNGDIAFSLSGALQDRLDSGEKSFVDVMDRRVAKWCAEAIGHQRAEARFITPNTIIALKNWK